MAIKIVGVEIQNEGKSVQIELKGSPKDYRYIFLDAEDLPTIADYSEHL